MRSRLGRPLRAALLGLLLPELAFGHAVLVASTIGGEEALLQFNVAVEPGLSEVRLLDAHERATFLEVRGGERPNLLVVKLPHLPPGDYALDYRVLARDGHLTEAALPFRIEE